MSTNTGNDALKILLVEDSPVDAQLVRMALSDHAIRHDLTLLDDGHKALTYASEMKNASGAMCPDVVLLDMNVPPTDGATILKEIRKCPDCANTPVIVVSCSDTSAERGRMAALGANRYVKKAMDLTEAMQLGEIVLDVLQERKAPVTV